MTAHNRLTAADAGVGITGLIITGVGAWVMTTGPSGLLPVHYGLTGAVDRWGSRLEVGGLIVGLGLLLAILGVGLGMAAGRSADPARQRTLRAAQLVCLVAILAVAIFAGWSSLTGVTSIAGGLPMAGLSLILMLIGAFLGRVGPNPFVGLRTPWTYKSRLAWDRSNRLAGRLLFLLGLIGVAAAFVAPEPAGLVVLLGGVMAAVVWAVIESWRVWRADPDRQPF